MLKSGARSYFQMSLPSSGLSLTSDVSACRLEKDLVDNLNHETTTECHDMGCYVTQRNSWTLVLPAGTTMNEQKFVDFLKWGLKQYMTVHKCKNFMQDSSPCHRSSKEHRAQIFKMVSVKLRCIFLSIKLLERNFE